MIQKRIKHAIFEGYTVVTLFNDKTHELRYGFCKTHPKDQFSRKVGRTLATYRAENSPVLVETIAFNGGENDLKLLLRFKLDDFFQNLQY